jgi:hypothetical protein
MWGAELQTQDEWFRTIGGTSIVPATLMRVQPDLQEEDMFGSEEDEFG